MIEILRPRRRPAWLTNVIALGLVLAVSAMLIYVCKNGPPTRPAMGFLIAVLLITPALLNWRWGWPVLFLYFPFGTLIRRLYQAYQPVALGGNDPLVILPDALMGTMAVGFMLSIRMRKAEPPLWAEKPLRVGILLLMVLCFLEVFNPMMGSISLGANGLRQFTLWMFLYFLVPTIISNRQQLYTWLQISLFTGTITGLYGAYQYIYDFPSWDQRWAVENYASTQVIGEQMRAFSTYTFTSTFSHAMIVASAIATLTTRLKTIGTFTRLLSPFFLACTLLGLAVTFVRSSYLGLLFGWVVGVVVGGKAKGRWLRFLAVMVIGYGAMSALPHSKGDATIYEEGVSTGTLVADRMLTMTEPNSVGSVNQRYQVWQHIIETSWRFPAGIGIGAGGAGRLTNDFIISAMAYSESQLFSMLAEMGWPGVFLFVWVVVCGMAYALLVYDRIQDPDLKRVVQMMLMIEVGISIAGVSGGPILYTLPGSAYYWAALGIVCAVARMENLTVERVKREEAEALAARQVLAEGTT